MGFVLHGLLQAASLLAVEAGVHELAESLPVVHASDHEGRVVVTFGHEEQIFCLGLLGGLDELLGHDHGAQGVLRARDDQYW